MDPALFKSTKVSRGLSYRYYFSPAKPGSPTLLLLHGFGSSAAREWRQAAPYFVWKGWGVIALDLLGYGGTDKPTDPALYVGSAMSKDVVDILDAEGIDKVIVVGYDWGVKVASRLANWFPERCVAYAFLNIPYWKPHTGTFQEVLDVQKAKVGYELFGYWHFFSEDNIDEVLQANMDSFASIIFPQSLEVWKTKVCPIGTLKETVLGGFTSPLPHYMSTADLEDWKANMAQNGWTAPMCWYKVMTSHIDFADDAQIPQERLYPQQDAPMFFGACKQDPLLRAEIGYEALNESALKGHNITTREFDADHWVLYSHVKEVCEELVDWVENVVCKA